MFGKCGSSSTSYKENSHASFAFGAVNNVKEEGGRRHCLEGVKTTAETGKEAQMVFAIVVRKVSCAVVADGEMVALGLRK